MIIGCESLPSCLNDLVSPSMTKACPLPFYSRVDPQALLSIHTLPWQMVSRTRSARGLISEACVQGMFLIDTIHSADVCKTAQAVLSTLLDCVFTLHSIRLRCTPSTCPDSDRLQAIPETGRALRLALRIYREPRESHCLLSINRLHLGGLYILPPLPWAPSLCSLEEGKKPLALASSL